MESDASIRTHALAVTTDVYGDPDHSHVAWPAILGGAAVAVATWIALQLFGFGIGLLSVHIEDGGAIRGAGIGTGVWGAIAPIIAFFLGGIVVGHGSRAVSRASQIVNASVTWAVGAIVGMFLLAMLVAALVRGAASASATIASGAAKAVGASASTIGDMARSSGLHASDALAPVNQRLRAEGKPAITAAQLEAAVKDVVTDAVQSGTLDRESLKRSIASETALSDTDAQDVANGVQAQYDRGKQQVEAELNTAKQKALHAAQAAAESMGKVMAGLFIALVLAMLAMIGGAMVGGLRYRDERALRR